MEEGERPNLNVSEKIKAEGENTFRRPLTELYTPADHQEAANINLEDVWKGWNSEPDKQGNIIKTNQQTGEQFMIKGEIDKPGYRVTRLK